MILAPLLAALLGQQQPAAADGPQPSAAPSFTLAIGRQVQYWPGGDWRCLRLGDELICPRHSSARYDHVRALAGAPVGDRHEGYSVADRAWSHEPVLFVINWDPDDPRVEIQAAADASGRACIPRAEFDRLGWHPAGEGIVEADGAICADLSPLVAIWAPNDVYTVTMVDGRRVRPVRGSLIVGRIIAQHESDLPACPPGQRCYRWVVDARMADVETLSGETVPPAATITLTQDTAPPDTDRILMIVRRMAGGRWVGYWTWPVAPAGQETCYVTHQTAGFTIRHPPRARVRDRQTCLAL